MLFRSDDCLKEFGYCKHLIFCFVFVVGKLKFNHGTWFHVKKIVNKVVLVKVKWLTTLWGTPGYSRLDIGGLTILFYTAIVKFDERYYGEKKD